MHELIKHVACQACGSTWRKPRGDWRKKKSSSNIARDFNNSSYLVSSPRKPRFVLVPIRFASEAWPQPGLPEPRSASIVGFGNTGPLSLTEQKGKDCHDQDKQAQGASFGFVFGTLN